MTSDPKRQYRRIFDEAVDRYDQDIGLFERFGQQLVERAAIGAGDRVLDLACGTGASLIPAACAVGVSGEVVGVDLSPAMVRAANSALAAQGLAARTEVMDIEELAFEDEAFDVVQSGFGVFFSEDVPHYLSGVRRVLSAEGRFAFTLFDGPFLFPWLFDVLLAHSDVEPGEEHPLWTVSGAIEQLRAAGFGDPVVHHVTERFVVKDADAVWRIMWTLGTRRLLEEMDSVTKAALEREIADRLEGHRIDDGYEASQAVAILVAQAS